MMILINTNRQAYHSSIHARIEEELEEVSKILKENDNLGHTITWDYRNDAGEVYGPGAYLSVVIHPAIGVYWNTEGVKFLRKLKQDYIEGKSKKKVKM